MRTPRQIAETHRGRLYELLANSDLGIRSEELELHFVGMPLRYWPRVDSATLRWHLDIIHEFIDGLARSDVMLAPPVVRWRHLPDRGFSEVVVCTWDRLGLLAKIAGSFAAVGLNIVRADIYTRADNVVLDVFQVCDEQVRHVQDISRLKQMEQLLTVALSPNGGGDSGPADVDAARQRAVARRTCEAAPRVRGDVRQRAIGRLHGAGDSGGGSGWLVARHFGGDFRRATWTSPTPSSSPRKARAADVFFLKRRTAGRFATRRVWNRFARGVLAALG